MKIETQRNSKKECWVLHPSILQGGEAHNESGLS
jgi:hypothetical protein